jgi:hypothetical protein
MFGRCIHLVAYKVPNYLLINIKSEMDNRLVDLLDWFANLWHGNFIAQWDGQVDKNLSKKLIIF